MINIPTKIYLQIGEDCPEDADFKDLAEITWSEEQLNDNDIEFQFNPTEPHCKHSFHGLSYHDGVRTEVCIYCRKIKKTKY